MKFKALGNLKLTQLILVLLTIICNEIVVEFVLSDEHKVSVLDSSAEEKSEQENIEFEAEAEADIVKVNSYTINEVNNIGTLAFGRNISNVTNPFLEIHSPPPDLFNITSIV